MVNAAAAHNSSQRTSTPLYWTEALYFPKAILLFYQQAFYCQRPRHLKSESHPQNPDYSQNESYLVVLIDVVKWSLASY